MEIIYAKNETPLLNERVKMRLPKNEADEAQKRTKLEQITNVFIFMRDK